jgi:hypothetical protein
MKVNIIRAVILAIVITGGIVTMTLKGEAVKANPNSQIKEVSYLQELLECENSIINNYNQKYTNIVCKYAKEYSVSATQIANIINCENRGWNPTLQSGLYYKKDRVNEGVYEGQREESYGLAQIHLPAHKNISYSQATNPDFSIEYLAKSLSEGKGSQWTCYI